METDTRCSDCNYRTLSLKQGRALSIFRRGIFIQSHLEAKK